jgi:MFS family permease
VNAVTMPVMRSLSEIFGRPYCLTFGVGMFTIGTIICCRASNIAALLAGRSIQGVGGGTMDVLSSIIMTDIVPLRYRPQWFGIM